jgi:hypothetical protein
MDDRNKTAPEAPASPKAQPSTRAKARIGKKAIVGYYSPEMSEQLGALSRSEDKTMQVVLGESLNMMFASKGLPVFEIE